MVDFKELIEPLRLLFKDEVRAMGLELGLPDYLVWRQPFRVPGLGIRVLGEVTPDKVAILQEDRIGFSVRKSRRLDWIDEINRICQNYDWYALGWRYGGWTYL